MKKIKIIFIAISVFSIALSSCSDKLETTATKAPSTKDALAESFGFVKDQLKAPNDASFGYYEQDAVRKIDDSTFAVNNYVDAKNDFGVSVRKNYSCIIAFHAGAQTECIDLKIGE